VPPLNSDGVARLIYYLAARVLFGGRLGYALFYNLPYLLRSSCEDRGCLGRGQVILWRPHWGNHCGADILTQKRRIFEPERFGTGGSSRGFFLDE
jgi:hypothetical protein